MEKLSLSDQVVLMKLYVDDLNQAGYCLPIGSRYIKGKLYIPGIGWKGRSKPGQALTYLEKKEIENDCNNLNSLGGTQAVREKNSAEIYRVIANECKPKSIRMKEDIPANHDNGRIPILDTEMEVRNGRIIHYHYSKPMASLEVTNRRSAMSLSSKLSILVQEGIRRTRNMSKELPWEENKNLLQKLMIQMYWAGYSYGNREIVIRRILAKIDNDLASHIHEGRQYYRSKTERRQAVKSDKAT